MSLPFRLANQIDFFISSSDRSSDNDKEAIDQPRRYVVRKRNEPGFLHIF